MRIGDRLIERAEPGGGARAAPYIIAELGVNHDGSEERAIELVRIAAAAGADAIKVQVFEADLLMGAGAALASYQERAGERGAREMLRRLELPLDSLWRVAEAAHERGLHAIATVFSVELVGTAVAGGSGDDTRAAGCWDGFKTASPDIINRPLIDALLDTGAPLIVSTGAATLDEVARAAGWIEAAGAISRTAMLQCVSSYPADPGREALGGIAAIARVFTGPVGYSDHTVGEETGASAARAGATILEKHLTHDRGARGPDHAASLDGAGFASYVRRAREACGVASRRRPVGPEVKELLDCEREVRRLSRQSLTAARALPAGSMIGRDDLVIRRPGTGIEPWRLGEVVGARLARGVAAGAPLTEADLLMVTA